MPRLPGQLPEGLMFVKLKHLCRANLRGLTREIIASPNLG